MQRHAHQLAYLQSFSFGLPTIVKAVMTLTVTRQNPTPAIPSSLKIILCAMISGRLTPLSMGTPRLCLIDRIIGYL